MSRQRGRVVNDLDKLFEISDDPLSNEKSSNNEDNLSVTTPVYRPQSCLLMKADPISEEDEDPKTPSKNAQEVIGIFRSRVFQKHRSNTILMDIATQITKSKDDITSESVGSSVLSQIINHEYGIVNSVLKDFYRANDDSEDQFQLHHPVIFRCVERLIGTGQGKASSVELKKILESAKDSSGRSIFLALLKIVSDSRANLCLDTETYDLLLVVFRAVLRMCCGQKDFESARDIISFSCRFYKQDPNSDQILLLNGLKGHEMWVQIDFWRQLFQEMIDKELERILGAEINEYRRIWLIMSHEERKEWIEVEQNMVIELLGFFLDLMKYVGVGSGVSKSFIRSLREEGHVAHETEESIISALDAPLSVQANGVPKLRKKFNLVNQLTQLLKRKDEYFTPNAEMPDVGALTSSGGGQLSSPRGSPRGQPQQSPQTPQQQPQQQLLTEEQKEQQSLVSGGGQFPLKLVNFNQIKGEKYFGKKENTIFWASKIKVEGVLLVSNFRIFFSPYQNKITNEITSQFDELKIPGFLSIPLGSCLKIEQLNDFLVLTCKDFRLLRFDLGAKSDGIVKIIQSRFSIDKEYYLFPFQNYELRKAMDQPDPETINSSEETPYTPYSPIKEFTRLGVPNNNNTIQPITNNNSPQLHSGPSASISSVSSILSSPLITTTPSTVSSATPKFSFDEKFLSNTNNNNNNNNNNYNDNYSNSNLISNSHVLSSRKSAANDHLSSILSTTSTGHSSTHTVISNILNIDNNYIDGENFKKLDHHKHESNTSNTSDNNNSLNNNNNNNSGSNNNSSLNSSLNQNKIQSHHSWRFTEINKDFSFCSTYSPVLVVPSRITDEDLKSCMEFRSKHRIPILSWINPYNEAAICRCAQPLPGVTRHRCAEDEKLIKEIMRANQNNISLVIIDARPKTNAVGNQVMGKGFESGEFYVNCNIQFMGIENIHVVRESFFRLRDLIQKKEGNWLSGLENTGWLKHIQSIMGACCRIVDFIDQKAISVLVHCSDGWDRTSQLTSLSQLLLDPYYRTIEGYQVLIEKEWLHAGHMFSTRSGHIGKRGTTIDEQWSPIFLQFIDATYQILQQYPTSFEFNEDFLIFILDGVYGCRYGNFLFDCEKERQNHQISRLTPSIWVAILNEKEKFLNRSFEQNNRVLIPCPRMRALKLWTKYYLRYDVSMFDWS